MPGQTGLSLRRIAEAFGWRQPHNLKRQAQVILTEGYFGEAGETPPQGSTEKPTLYHLSDAVYVAVNAIARRVAAAQFGLYRELADGNLEEISAHPLLNLLRSPNRFMTGWQLRWHIIADMELFGNSYLFLEGPANKQPVAIWRMNPRNVRVVRDKRNYVGGYVYEVDGRQIPLFPAEVIHFKNPNPYDEHDLYGWPTLAVAAASAKTGIAMQKWNYNMFSRDNAVPAGIVNVTDWVSDADFERIIQDWRRNFGSGQRKTAFLRGGRANFQPVGLSHTDLDWLNGLDYNRNVIFEIFGVFHMMLRREGGDPAGRERQFLEETLWPKLTYIFNVFTEELATFWGPQRGSGKLYLIPEDVRPRDRAIRLEEEREARKSMTLNEVRLKDNLPPVDGGDGIFYVHFLQGALVPGEETGGYSGQRANQPTASNPTFERQSIGETPETAEERAERRENSGSEIGDGYDVPRPPRREPANKTALVAKELARWQKYCLNRLERGESMNGFRCDYVPEVWAERIAEALEEAATPEGVKAVFDHAYRILNDGLDAVGDEDMQALSSALLADRVDFLKGTSRFTADALAYARLLTLPCNDEDEIAPALKAIRDYQNTHLPALKVFDTTGAMYRSVLYQIITDAMRIDADGKPVLDRRNFLRQGKQAINIYFQAAYLDGLNRGGVLVDRLEDDEQAEIAAEIKAEQAFFDNLARDVYDDLGGQLEALRQQQMVTYASVGPERDLARQQFMEMYHRYLAEARKIVDRIELWVNKGLSRVYNLGISSARDNPLLGWRLGKTEEHCETCLAAARQVHRAKRWKEAGLTPKSDTLLCGGFRCDCEFVQVQGRAKGRFTDIPRKEVINEQLQDV